MFDVGTRGSFEFSEDDTVVASPGCLVCPNGPQARRYTLRSAKKQNFSVMCDGRCDGRRKPSRNALLSLVFHSISISFYPSLFRVSFLFLSCSSLFLPVRHDI